MSARNIIVVLPLAIWLLAEASGCGGGGPTRYELSGKATFEGKPIPHGRIVFEPDASKKNAGPQGFANIKDGQFDTSDGGQGHIGGDHLIRVEGFDAVPGAGAAQAPFQRLPIERRPAAREVDQRHRRAGIGGRRPANQHGAAAVIEPL